MVYTQDGRNNISLFFIDVLYFNQDRMINVYKKIMLDGKEIEIRTDLDEKQTGIIIDENLEKTDDLQDVVNYISNEDITNE